MIVRLGVVILAAGASSRMGRPKLLLPWGGTTVLAHLLAQWRQAGAGQTAVVVASGDEAMAAELDRLGVPREHRITNPARDRGMFSSIQCSAQWDGWRADLTHVAITLGDQPQLRLETLQQLARFAGANPGMICQPAWRQRAKHPVLLPWLAFAELRNTGAATLKEFIQSRASRRSLCAIDDPGLDLDIDTPADYERACRIAFGEGTR